MRNSQPYLNNLTPLRGIAALWVATFHFRGLVNNLLPSHYTMLLEKGYSMVDLFFVMSGFIMIHVYENYFSQEVKNSNTAKFFVARFARIYPLHFFTLLIFFLLSLFSWGWNETCDPAAIPTNLLLLQSFHIDDLRTWNTVSWSISAEWAAYLCFPFLAVMLSLKQKLVHFLLFAITIFIYLALLYWLPSEDINSATANHRIDATYSYGFLRGIAGFSLGMLVYSLFHQIKIRNILSKDLTAYLLIVMTLICMHKDSNDLLLIFAFAGLVISFASNVSFVHKISSFAVLQFVGKVSYSIYLLQTLVRVLFVKFISDLGIVGIFPASNFFSRLAYTIAYLMLLTGISSITYFGIENPCRNFINRRYARLTRRTDIKAVSGN